MTSISPRDVDEGQRIRLRWKPYGWARENEGLTSVDKSADGLEYLPVTVTAITGTQKKGHMYDITLETSDGTVLTHHVDNGYISGPAENTNDVPDRTDVGRFLSYRPY